MKALVLEKCVSLKEEKNPLTLKDLPKPVPERKELLIRVHACGVCHTELDEIEGRTAPPALPVIPGHQVIGTIEQLGPEATLHQKGDRVGVGWVHSACGYCEHCLSGNENLCPEFSATGRDMNGGYAEYMKIDEAFAIPIPEIFSDNEAAPLMCAGAIGYRSLKLTNFEDGQTLGLMGFGASAHLVLKLVRHQYPKSRVFVFARSAKERAFAIEIGADWSGDIDEQPPEPLNSIIDTTPAWKPVVSALDFLKPGGRLVINAIRKESHDRDWLGKINYETHLWMEKEIKSVANVSRNDISEFLKIAASIPIRPEIQVLQLEEANQALVEIATRKIRGAKVLTLL